MVKYTYSVAAPVVSMKKSYTSILLVAVKITAITEKKHDTITPTHGLLLLFTEPKLFGASPRLDNENNIREHV